jgi:glucosyl-3-phosphoglycerate synthase
MTSRRSHPPIVSRHYRDFPLRDLVAAKGDELVSVCIPARDEAETIGDVVTKVRRFLGGRLCLVDEVLVVDDHSRDETGKAAAHAGARVVDAAEVLADVAGGPGKGEALWRSLYASIGDIVVWCDADITDFGTRFVSGLLGPLITDPDVAFVKGYYERPRSGSLGGGRTTELTARPALATLFPQLSTIVQPLSGEFGGRRALLERLPFVRGYGVDIGLLIDVARAVGTEAIVQVDLGTRRHRHHDLDQLGPQALSVLQTVLDRAGVPAANPATLVRPGLPPLARTFGELPPIATLRGRGRAPEPEVPPSLA